MKFVSTRGRSDAVDFLEAVLTGLAPDGGLYVPDEIPEVRSEWRTCEDFREQSAVVLHSWLASHVAPETLERVVGNALNFDVPLVPLDGEEWTGVHVVELFHGPTLSFKDFGARCMAGFMDAGLNENDRRTILVATSGDTGSAVADGFSGHEGISVVLLYPHRQVSRTQERQLIVRRPGVRSFAVDGTFDDCQRMVKDIFRQQGREGIYSSANSINVGRLIPQMVYYFWAASQMPTERFLCCVPSGNLGNLTAGVMGDLSGLRASRFLAAHNANSFFPDFLAGGSRKPRKSVQTLSNAMDVGIPSNFERLVALLDVDAMRRLLWSTSVDDVETLATIKSVHQQTGYTADPHTAVGLAAVRRYRQTTGDTAPIAVMATAHPAKFPETIDQALGFAPTIPDSLARYWDMDTEVDLIAPNTDQLLSRIAD